MLSMLLSCAVLLTYPCNPIEPTRLSQLELVVIISASMVNLFIRKFITQLAEFKSIFTGRVASWLLLYH